MLGESNRRETNPFRSNKDPSTSWEMFARDEGRRAAEHFIERLRSYKESHDDIPESVCVREFATVLTERLAGLMNDELNVPGSMKPKSKHWWNIFKRGKNTRKSCDTLREGDREIILDRLLTQMNLQDGDWYKCRVVLLSYQGNHQLEIYTPPKVSYCIVIVKTYIYIYIYIYCMYVCMYVCMYSYVCMWYIAIV